MANSHWIQLDGDKCKCSACETIAYIALYPPGADKNFCPNCGADMREVKMPKVLNARLLSTEEAMRYMKVGTRRRGFSWWLKDAVVGCDGNIFNYGSTNTFRFVCPALDIDISNTGFGIGDKFEFGGLIFKIISPDLAWTNNNLGLHRFYKDYDDDPSYYYQNSDIKCLIDSWFRTHKTSK